MSRRSQVATAAIGATLALVAAGCTAASGASGGSASSCKKTDSPALTLAAYSNV
jgi:hypothetical protein